MFETNGPGLIKSIRESWRSGGRKYFWHNLSCELRRGRHKECYGYQNTWWDRFLFSLGMFIMDWRGRHFLITVKWENKFRSDERIWLKDTQWMRHPAPWIAKKARKMYGKEKWQRG